MMYILLAVGACSALISFSGYKIANNSCSRTVQTIGMLMLWLAGASSVGSFGIVIGCNICKYLKIV